MKYIDAEKLKAEIERLHKAHSGKYGCDEVGVNLEYLEDFIDSIQQEHPEKILTFDGFVDKVGTWFANLRLNKFRETFNGEIFPATQLVQEYDLFVQELSKRYSDKQEQPSLPSDLDEAAERIVVSLVPTFGQKYEDGSYVKGIRDYFSRDEFIGLVKAGAVWQKEQNDKDLSEKIAAAYQLGLADKEKQMMSEAVECIVEDWNPEPHPEITIPLNPGKFSNGDRARIIIVKED